MSSDTKTKIGLSTFITALILFLLIKLPFNFSSLCTSDNEAFYLIYGQNFLLWKELAGGIFFTPLFSLILKLSGFNTWSIVIVHLVQTFITLATGVLIFLIVKKVTKDVFYSALAVLFWVILMLTPIGSSPLPHEITGLLALEGEQLCMLTSLVSVFFLICAGFINTEGENNSKVVIRNIYSFFAGIFSFLPLMFKANGIFFVIAVFLWTIYNKLFNKDFFLKWNKLCYFLLGFIVCFVICNFFLCVIANQNELISFWRSYFLIGYYRSGEKIVWQDILTSLPNVITKGTSSINNIILLGSAFFLFIYGIIKRNSQFLSLIGFWGFGNALAIAIPGKYESYYYHLLYPLISIAIAFTLKELLKSSTFIWIKFSVIVLLFMVFLGRIVLVIPAYFGIFSALKHASIFRQVQSLQDPVLPYNPSKVDRPEFLQVADKINLLLPNKQDTLYVFNFTGNQYPGISTTSYIYAKRYPPTSIIKDVLEYNTVIERKLNKLKSDLIKRPPNLLVLSKDLNFKNWQKEKFKSFLIWFYKFIEEKYVFSGTLSYKHPNQSREVYLLYKLG